MIVLPERMELVGVGDLQSAALNTRAQGWNAALDEVARLNRCAIPADLLDRISAYLVRKGSEGFKLHEELRALLGK